jgi:lipoate-protein ligase B
VHRYVRNLEKTAIETLKDFELVSSRRTPYSGIWIEDRKIAALGLAVRRGITYHGLALNVNTELSYFDRIIPCGLTWAEVTSMAQELGTEQNAEIVKESFIGHFADLFGYDDVKRGWEEFGCHTTELAFRSDATTGTSETISTIGTLK